MSRDMSETLEQRLLIDKWTPREEAVWRKLGREAVAELSRLRAELEARDEIIGRAIVNIPARTGWRTADPNDGIKALKAALLAAEQALKRAREAALRKIKELHPDDDFWTTQHVQQGLDEWVARLDAWSSDAVVRLEICAHDRILLAEFLRTLPSEPVNTDGATK